MVQLGKCGNVKRRKLTKEETSDKPDNKSHSLVEVIQLASVALSDRLQMADDLIRALLQCSHLAGAAAPGVVAPVDSAVVKLAVQKGSKSFRLWLAAALEQLVRCKPSLQDEFLLEVYDEESEEDNAVQQRHKVIIPKSECKEGNGEGPHWAGSSINLTCFSKPANKYKTFNLLDDLLVQLDNGASGRAYFNFLLEVFEMCCLAKCNMAKTLNQSIQSAMEQDAPVADSANTLFGDTIDPHCKGKDGLNSDQMLFKRFQLAASWLLAMYVMNCGAYAALELFTEMFRLSDARDPYVIPSRPHKVCLNVFEIAKASCEDCISIEGGDLFVTPVAIFPDEMGCLDVFGESGIESAIGGGDTQYEAFIGHDGLSLIPHDCFIYSSRECLDTILVVHFKSVVSSWEREEDNLILKIFVKIQGADLWRFDTHKKRATLETGEYPLVMSCTLFCCTQGIKVWMGIFRLTSQR